MPQEEDTITTTAAERRLGGALMWTGALLGAMFIAVLGLGFTLYTTSFSDTSTVKTLVKENKELKDKLDTKTEALNKTSQELKDAIKAKEELQKAAAKPVKRAAAPRPVDPY